jgi:hypothetical protein
MGGEMTQALYAHMNNKIIKKIFLKETYSQLFIEATLRFVELNSTIPQIKISTKSLVNLEQVENRVSGTEDKVEELE